MYCASAVYPVDAGGFDLTTSHVGTPQCSRRGWEPTAFASKCIEPRARQARQPPPFAARPRWSAADPEAAVGTVQSTPSAAGGAARERSPSPCGRIGVNMRVKRARLSARDQPQIGYGIQKASDSRRTLNGDGGPTDEEAG
jgi:hypothetical protein